MNARELISGPDYSPHDQLVDFQPFDARFTDTDTANRQRTDGERAHGESTKR
ncbi:MAG: hypothetical protein ACTHPD_05625 [Rhizomicrobium sp.]